MKAKDLRLKRALRNVLLLLCFAFFDVAWAQELTVNNGTVTESANITAYFQQIEYYPYITSMPEGSGWGEIVGLDYAIHYGDTVTIRAIPNQDFRFYKWTIWDGDDYVDLSTDSIYTFTFDESFVGYNEESQGEIEFIANFVECIGNCVRSVELTATEVGPTFTTLSWTELGVSESWYVCYHDVNQSPLEDSYLEVYENPYTLTDLLPNTDYQLFVIPSCAFGDGELNYYLSSNTIDITTLESCPTPMNVGVTNVTSTSSTVTWVGYSNSYNVQVDLVNTILNEYFDDGIPSDWNNSADYPWTIVNGHMQSSNAGIANSTSSISVTATFPTDGAIDFDAECMGEGSSTYWDHCDFYIDGEILFNVGENLNTSGWLHYSYPVTVGQHTFTWSYTKDSSLDPTGDYFAVDNVVMRVGEIEWSNVLVEAPPYTFIDLDMATTYCVRVQGICDNILTEWSNPVFFTTTETESYLITAIANPANAGTVTGGGVFNAGETCTLTATANAGYTFIGWTENEIDVSTNAEYSFIVTSHRNLMARFEEDFTPPDPPTQTHWTFNTDATYFMTLTGAMYLDGESMQNNPRSEYLEIGAFCGYECRGSCLATLNPAPFAQGYFYQMMLYSDVQSGEAITFRIWDHEANAYLDVICTSNITFVADDGIGNLMIPYELTFTTNGGTTPTSFTISATGEPAEGGVVSGAGTYDVGDDCTLSASANPGYSFVNWTEDGQVISSNVEYTFMVTGDRNIVAHFTSEDKEITVYDGTMINVCVPSYVYYFDSFTKSQFVIPAADLAVVNGNTINSVKFYTDSYNIPYTTISTVDIYLKEVNYTTISNYEAKTNCQVVYTGTMGFVAEGSGGTCLINFTTPFEYNGGNLLVGCENTTDFGYKLIRFYGQSVNGASIAGCNGTSLENVTATQRNFIPKTTFTYVPNNCPSPSNLNVTNVASTTATLNWTENGNADTWEIFFNQDNLRRGSIIVNENPYTLTGLTPEVICHAQIRAYCSDNEQSVWSNTVDFTPSGFYTVTVSANPANAGTVTGGGSYEVGQTCTVVATANEGYAFVNWTQDEAIVSTNTEFTFYVVGNVELVAHFASEDNINFADTNVKTLCVSHWDMNGDGELSYAEAAAVTNLGQVFRENTEITSFEELQYFIGLTTISSYAFYNCSNLSGTLYIPNSVTEIGSYAFEGCSSFTGSLTIPNNVITVGSYAFDGCSGFYSLSIGNSVTTIGDYAFMNCFNFWGNLTIPNSVTSIGDWAFAGCNGFTGTLIIPNTVMEIGLNPFTCYGIEQIIVELDNPNYDSRENCNAIIKTGTNELISGCKNTIIPNSVTIIGDYAFFGSNYTGSLTIPNSVTIIGNYAFGSCWGLSGSLTIPNSVTTIGELAFSNCHGFTGNLIIPNSVTTIGFGAFTGCSGFTGTLSIPKSVTSIGDGSFVGCSGLVQIIVDSENTVYDSRENCNAIIKTSINQLIMGCKSTVIPNSVTFIDSDAFWDCSGLTSIEIPNSVVAINHSAFAFCSGLTLMKVLADNPPFLGDNVFYNVNKSIPVYVLYGTKETYMSASGWNEFTNYQEIVYKTVPGYNNSEGNYRFIASPLVENTAPTTVDNMITETPYDLYRFDQSEDAEWQNYKAQTESFVLENGQGYLYANADEVNVIFKGEFNEDETKEVELAYEANAEFAGWNLVGNPFPVSAYANRSYYTMNEAGTAVEPNMVSSATAIPTCTGVMVKADDQGETVVFNTTAPETASNKGSVQIALSQVVDRGGVSTGSTTLQDKAIVSFNAGDRLEKFVFNKDNARISIPQGGKDLAIACAEKQGEMPLNFKAIKNGTYTLGVDVEDADVDYLHLIDNLTGADIDLLALRQAQGPAKYTFTAKITDYASRFRLVFSVCGDADGDNDNDNEAFAFINNGNIIIDGEGTVQVIDVMGRVIACRDAARHVSTSGMTPGVYVLRLINGDNVKTQKIVIR